MNRPKLDSVSEMRIVVAKMVESMPKPHVGARYRIERTLPEIAKRVRADIHAATIGGSLPIATYHVTCVRRTVDVRVSNVARLASLYNASHLLDRLEAPEEWSKEPLYTPMAAAVLAKVEAILAAYNLVRTVDGRTERHFFADVGFEPVWARGRRTIEAAAVALGVAS